MHMWGGQRERIFKGSPCWVGSLMGVGGGEVGGLDSTTYESMTYSETESRLLNWLSRPDAREMF